MKKITNKINAKLKSLKNRCLNLIKLNQNKNTQAIGRFTEASLVKKLDEMGIGRPSTYSSMVSIVQDRNYVERKRHTR